MSITQSELNELKKSIISDIAAYMKTAGLVTQYIGARYVPLFADPIEWDDTREFEPLTIVLRAGNSYTSRQHVPKGVDITESDFWANTGNYNAQIEQYRQEVAKYRDEVLDFVKETEKRVIFFQTVEEMTSYDLKLGWLVQTAGFRSVGVGAGLYQVTDEPSDGYTKLALTNGLTATLIFGDELNVDAVGAFGDGKTDDSPYINAALKACKHVNFSAKTYKIDNTLELDEFSTITGTIYETRLATANNIILMHTPFEHFKIEGIWFTAIGDNNSAQAFYAERPYDGCVLRDCIFDGFGDVSIKIGADTTEISQTFTMDNCVVYSRESPTKCMLELNRAYESNILNSKFLFRGANASVPCVICNYVWNANFTGCSFMGTQVEALRFTDNCRYNRITNNTFENIGSQTKYSISALIKDYSNGQFTANVIIFSNYYNAYKKIYVDKETSASSNIVLNGQMTDSYSNLSFFLTSNYEYDGTHKSPVFHVPNETKNQLLLYTTNFILARPDGGLVLTDSAGKKWQGKISTEGTLQFTAFS